MEQREWFKDWFSSEYYKLLYNHRDEKEAEVFIKNLVQNINLKEGSKIWDNGCGRGRHSYIFSKLGYVVIGTDINEVNIEDSNRKYKNENLIFAVHDMRKEFYVNYFDMVVNLFTSLGYFNYLYEEVKVLEVMFRAVKNSGWVIIDYLNPDYVLKKIVPHETKIIDNISFDIRREIQSDVVFKYIRVKDGNKVENYMERVRLLDFEFFQKIFQKNNLNLLKVWGDYELNTFNRESKRMIFWVEKNNLI